MVVLYGLGTTIGAGIYALIGEVARTAGMLAPLAFLLASFMAAFTALSFAEMACRFPRSAGEAVYVTQGLGVRWLGVVVGLLVVSAGTVSAAALVHGFVGYFGDLMPIPKVPVMVLAVLVLAAIAAWGIGESVRLAAVVTLVETGGLLLVVAFGADALAELPNRWREFELNGGASPWAGVMAAALLAFYAFLGFEDMVNVAEEIKDVERILPRAIVMTLVLTTLVYFLVAIVSVLVVAPMDLADAGAPLTLVYERAGGYWPSALSVVGVLAMINGALIQLIMASRVVYGLARQGTLPMFLAAVHPKRRTPLCATALIGMLVLAAALWFPLAALAEWTSRFTLTVFAMVNLALLVIKWRRAFPAPVWAVPVWVPAIGFVVSFSFLGWGFWRWV